MPASGQKKIFWRNTAVPFPSIMGNRSSCFEDDLNDDNPLNKSERDALFQKFNELCPSDTCGDAQRARFLKEFASTEVPHFSTSIYDSCRESTEHSLPTLKLFQKFAVDVSRSTSSNVIRKIWSLTCTEAPPSDSMGHTRASSVLRLMLECSKCDRLHLGATADRLSEHMEYTSSAACNRNRHRDVGGEVNSATEDTGVDSETELAQFLDWANEYTPHLAKVFVTYFNSKLFPEVQMQGGYKPFIPPMLDPLESSDIVHSSADLMPLALYDLSMQGAWKRLYTTQKDGLSFNRIAHHILGYDGPNIILIRVAGSGIVLGAYNEDNWKESNRFFGSSVSFLFTLLPHMHIFRSKAASNSNYQWLNLKSYGMPHGLGMGGDLEKFRLYLPDTLEKCVARNNCLTFETGSFFNDYRKSSGTAAAATCEVDSPSGPEFEIDVMEVWGCGGTASLEHALMAQAKDRGDRDALIQKARQVDKAQFANNSFDQEFLLGKTFGHKVRMADDAACHSTGVTDGESEGKNSVGKSGISAPVV